MSTPDMIGTTHIGKVDAPAPAVFLHVAMFLPGSTTIGAETFRATKISGQEKVSESFEFQLELRANTSAKQDVPTLRFEQLIGRPVTFGIDRPDFRLPEDMLLEALTGASNDRFAAALKGGAPDPTLSLFNGIVTAFSMSEPGVYKASVKPALWKLSLTNRYRVLEQKSIAQAIEMLMREHGIRCSLAGIAGTHNLAQTRTQNWMQAGESDYALLQRLMGKAQIHYYFTHTGNTHTVVFSNTTNYPAIPFDRPLRYTSVDTSALGLTQADVVSQYTYEQSLVTSGVECVLARQQEAWDLDAIPTFQTYAAGPADPGALPFTQYRQFQYGVSDWQARESASVADASRCASAQRFSGASTCAQMRVGHRFTLSMPASGAAGQLIQPSLDQQVFVLTEVSHEASLDGDYRNSFSATDQHGLITPFSIEQTQQGSVLATVVDANGSSTPKSWRYYTSQNFEMVTSAQIDRDANPSTLQAKGVYVNFATDQAANATARPVWVKLAGHMQTVPEVGVTVVVARAQDESELPEIQSIVHANGTRTVTPMGWTATTAIGNSFSTSYSDSKNIRFGANSDVSSDSTLDDAIDTVTQAYDTRQYREASYAQGASFSYLTSEQKEQGLLSRSLAYGSTHSQSWAAQQQNFSAVGRSYSENIVGQASPEFAQPTPSPAPDAVSVNLSTVYGGTHSASTHHGDVTSLNNVIGNSSSVNTVTGISVSHSIIEENQSTSVTGKSTNNNTTDTSTEISKTRVLNSTSTIESHTSITTTGTSDTSTVTDSAKSTTRTGKHESFNMVRESTTIDMQGVASTVTIAGDTTRLNLSGDSTDITICDTHTQVSLSASSHTISAAGPGIRINADAESPEINMTNATITIVGVIQIYL